jgi:hypothetical protein
VTSISPDAVPANGWFCKPRKLGMLFARIPVRLNQSVVHKEVAMHKEQQNATGGKERRPVNKLVNKVTNDKAREVKGKSQKHAGSIAKRYGGAKGAIRKND